MNGPQIRLSLAELGKALNGSDKGLKAFVKKCIEEAAERYQVKPELLIPLVDEVVEKVKDDSQKWNTALPYPQPHMNNMSIQLDLPKVAKIGTIEYNAKIVV